MRSNNEKILREAATMETFAFSILTSVNNIRKQLGEDGKKPSKGLQMQIRADELRKNAILRNINKKASAQI